MKFCQASGCRQDAGWRRIFCTDHWNMLPGRLRSKLSLVSGSSRNPVAQDLIGRAKGIIDAA